LPKMRRWSSFSSVSSTSSGADPGCVGLTLSNLIRFKLVFIASNSGPDEPALVEEIEAGERGSAH
jgi:hypothetical protein